MVQKKRKRVFRQIIFRSLRCIDKMRISFGRFIKFIIQIINLCQFFIGSHARRIKVFQLFQLLDSKLRTSPLIYVSELQIALMGLQKNPRDAAFNRLAMYNYTDLKRYDEAMKAADAFFKESDKADFSYLDYMYFGHLLNAVKKYDQAVEAYMKAITLDPAKTDLWREVSSSYELNNEFTKAIEAYKKYSESLSADKRTPDVQFQIGKLYYEKGTQSDTLTVSLDERKAALVSADSIFTEIAKVAPDSYLGNFWRARTNSALDPETTQGLAKPYYEEVAAFLIDKNDPRYNSALIECYSYLGYYYLVANKLPESKEYWNKILAIDPANATAKRALDGIK